MRILAILAFLVLGFAYPSSANEWKALSDFSLAHLEKLKSSCSYRIAYSITSPFEKETFLFIDQLNVYPESPEGYDQQLIVHIPSSELGALKLIGSLESNDYDLVEELIGQSSKVLDLSLHVHLYAQVGMGRATLHLTYQDQESDHSDLWAFSLNPKPLSVEVRCSQPTPINPRTH